MEEQVLITILIINLLLTFTGAKLTADYACRKYKPEHTYREDCITAWQQDNRGLANLLALHLIFSILAMPVYLVYIWFFV